MHDKERRSTAGFESCSSLCALAPRQLFLNSSLNERTPEHFRDSSALLRLTEVHVLGLADRPPLKGKEAFGVNFRVQGGSLTEFTVKAKYQSYWCSNPLALTICVNANELRLSQ